MSKLIRIQRYLFASKLISKSEALKRSEESDNLNTSNISYELKMFIKKYENGKLICIFGGNRVNNVINSVISRLY